jgi:hypothetical protein
VLSAYLSLNQFYVGIGSSKQERDLIRHLSY